MTHFLSSQRSDWFENLSIELGISRHKFKVQIRFTLQFCCVDTNMSVSVWYRYMRHTTATNNTGLRPDTDTGLRPDYMFPLYRVSAKKVSIFFRFFYRKWIFHRRQKLSFINDCPLSSSIKSCPPSRHEKNASWFWRNSFETLFGFSIGVSEAVKCTYSQIYQFFDEVLYA